MNKLVDLRKFFFVLFAVFGHFLQPNTAKSMEFELVQVRSGALAVRATGEVALGDANKLLLLLDNAGFQHDGWTPLLLNSSGGDVADALDLALVIRDNNLMPVVLPGDTCDSSCAAILFLSGKRSLLTKGGTLFFHACIDKFNTLNAVQSCNRVMSEAMRQEHAITDEMLLLSLDGFAGNEAEVQREDRLIHANVADCMAIDLPPWTKSRPNPTRCGTGDLVIRDPMAAGVDVDRPASNQTERTPGQAHPVWFLFHWTPPDQWAFWRKQDGVALSMRPRGVFRNGPELRLSCLVTEIGDVGQNDMLLDLRLPDTALIRRASRLSLNVGNSDWVSSPVVQRFEDGPFVVDENPVTLHFFARFPQQTWTSLANSQSAIRVTLMASGGQAIWRRDYPVSGLSSRIDAVRSNCVGGLLPVE